MMKFLLHTLIVSALALKALLPAGFMLARAAGTEHVAIVICTGYGPQRIILDETGNPAPASEQHGAERCAFANTGAIPLSDEPPFRLPAEVRYAAVAYRVSREDARVTPKPGAVSARGPPIVLI